MRRSLVRPKSQAPTSHKEIVLLLSKQTRKRLGIVICMISYGNLYLSEVKLQFITESLRG